MPIHHYLPRRQNLQRGSILVQFALLAGALVSILGVVQLGYMYYVKRDLQRIADLAAIETVNAMSYGDPNTCTGTTGAMNVGKQSITNHITELNQLAKNKNQTPVVCGSWDASKADELRFTSNGAPLNSAQVTLEVEALQFLPFVAPAITAQAIAAKDGQSIASFQIGSQLLQFNKDRLLGKIGTAVGLDIEKLTVLDKGGIANARITPAGLLQHLNLPVNFPDFDLLTPDDLSKVNTSLLNLIDAGINVSGDSILNAGVDVGTLQALKAYIASSPIANVLVPLGGPGGILATVAGGRNGTIGSGLDVVLDIADLVRTQLVIANGKNAVALELPSALKLVTANLTVVEPPTVAIGPADGTTKARSAQVRLDLNIGGSGTAEGAGLVKTLLGVLGVELDIPIQVDLVRSTGTLEKIQCMANTNHKANISVHSVIGDVCIGNLDNSEICQKADLVKVNLLGILGGLTIKAQKKVSILRSSGSTTTQSSNAQQCPYNNGDECLIGIHVKEQPPRMSGPNGLRLGATIGGLLSTITDLVADVSNSNVTGPLGILLKPILLLIGGLQTVLNLVVGTVSSLLVPVLDTLGSILDPLLTSILGVEIGKAEVEVLKIQCDTAQIVR